jgi:hypothetical protein
VVSSIQVKEWIGSCLYPLSGQDFGLSIQERLKGEGLKPSLDLRVAIRFPEFSQDLEKNRKDWLLSICHQSRDNFANLVNIFGQRQKVSPQLLKCPQCLGKRLPRRGQCHLQHCDVALYCPEVNLIPSFSPKGGHERIQLRGNEITSDKRDVEGEEERENGEDDNG